MTDMWLSAFPMLDVLEAEAKELLTNSVQEVNVPADQKVFDDGMECSAFLFVLDGAVRVQKVSEQGREIVLYRVERGQSCLLTTFCLMNNEAYGAQGITETDVHAVVLPVQIFHQLVGSSAAFRKFVFSSFGSRVSDILLRIEEVAFRRVDIRLAETLSVKPLKTIKTTHQDLAVELGSVREVVSRQLKEFERRGWVELHRGRVEILNRQALIDFSKGLKK